MKILVVLVNYKTAAMTLDAVGALLPELEAIPDARAVVVDNDSKDGSFEKMSSAVRDKGWGERVQVVASEKNGGFGYGNNFAIRKALASKDPPEYVYLLNSDAFPEKASVRTLIEFMDTHPKAGIAGSYVHGPEGDPHETAFRFPSVASELESTLGLGVVSRLLSDFVVAMPIPTEITQVDWLAGASMMIRRQVLETVGLFDETFFLYFEEVDLCRRARLQGWPTYYVPMSSVAHIGSATTGFKDTKRRMPTYWFDSRRYYFLKNHGRPYLVAANVACVLGMSLGRVKRKIQRRAENERPNFFMDFVRYNFRLR